MKVGNNITTQAAEFGVGEISFGINLFRTELPLDEYKMRPKQIGGDLVYQSPNHKNGVLSTVIPKRKEAKLKPAKQIAIK